MHDSEKIKNSYFQVIPLIGMSLALVGVPMGMYLNHFFPIIKWSPIMMIISFILSINWNSLRSIHFFSIPISLGLLIVYALLLLFIIIYGDGFASTSFFYMLFVVAFSFAMATHKCDINYDFFPYVLFSVSLPCLLIGFFVCYLNMVVGAEANLNRLNNNHFALEPFSVAGGALTNMFSILILKMEKRNFYKNIFFTILLLGGLYVLSSCGKRTPLFVFIVGYVCLFYFKGYSFKHITVRNVRNVAFLFVAIVLSYFFIPFITIRVDKFFFEMYSGVLNLFGITSIRDTTGSAIMRVESREIAYEYIRTHMEWMDYFIGVGYNKIGQLDNPILQLFVESGIWGEIGYVYFIVVYPLIVIIKRISNTCVILCFLLSLHSIVSIINSGHPYMYNKYTPICILSVILLYYKKRGDYA